MIKKVLVFQISFILLLIASALPANAQQQLTVRGKVTDAKNHAPLEFATVEVRSIADHSLVAGAATDGKGEFFLKVKEAGKYLFITQFIGYKPQKRAFYVKGNDRIQITLEEDAVALNEVVVKGLTENERVTRLAYNVQMMETTKMKSTTMDLAHMIDKISGVKMRESGGVGSETNISLNGFSGRHVKVFIDGVPMDGMSSAFGLNNIPVGLAKRVEVYKGVVPVELGGDALGGAINIVTDNSRRTRVNASYSFGSFNTHKSNVYAEYTSKKGFYVSLNAYQNYSDNDYEVNIDKYTDLNTNTKVEGDFTFRRFHAKYHNEAAVLKIGIVDKPFADRLLFGFVGGYEYKQQQNGSNMNFVYGARYTTANTLMPSISYAKKFDVLKGLHISANGNYNFGQSYSADTATCNYDWFGRRGPASDKRGELEYTKYRYRDNNATANLHAILFPAEGHSVSLASTLSSFSRSGKDETMAVPKYDEHPQKSLKIVSGLSYKYDFKGMWNTSAFVKNYQNHLEAYLDPEGGTNYQEYSHTDSYWGGGITTTYFMGKHTQIKLSYEYAYRLPTSKELFGSGDGLERGTSNLKPETSNNINVGVTASPIDMATHRLTVDATFQYREINDYIRRTTNNDLGRASSSNEGGVRSFGGDFGIRYTFKDVFFVGGNFSYFDMRSMAKFKPGTQRESLNYKERIPAIPYMYGNAEAGVTLRNLFMKRTTLDIHYMMTYVHDFNYEWDSYHNNAYMIPTQLSHDAYISYNFGRKQEFTVSAECMNIFNEKLYDNFKLQKPGRSFSFKIAYNFNK